MLSIMNEIDPRLLLPLCVLYEIQNQIYQELNHIQMRYNFIRYLVEDKLVILEKFYGSKNPTDMLTKGVTIKKLKLCTVSVGLLA